MSREYRQVIDFYSRSLLIVSPVVFLGLPLHLAIVTLDLHPLLGLLQVFSAHAQNT